LGGSDAYMLQLESTCHFSVHSESNLEVYVAPDTANATATRLTNTAANESYPAWSPDYNKIVFTSERDGNMEIYTMKANGDPGPILFEGAMNGFSNLTPSWTR
jgi:Tol biopolymer transport system component